MNTTISEAAAQWLIEFRTDKPSVAARREFAAWLRTSPEHIREYLGMLALWEEASCYDQQHRLDIDALIALARTEHVVTDMRGVDLPAIDSDAQEPATRESHAKLPRKILPRRLLAPRTALAVILSLAINFGLWWIAIDSRNADYTTQIAEQRSVVLSDGSQVDLDALSKLQVRFTRGERTVELLSGEAQFRVTKDSRRPFVVRTDGARFRAVGTQFDINLTGLGAALTVLEGRVAAFGSRTGADGPHVVVAAGQQAMIVHNKITAPQSVDTAAAIGWTHRLLTFTSTPLVVAADEFNRFNSRRLQIGSAALADFPVTGTYRALDPESLVDFVLYLRRQPGIDVLEQDHQIIVQSRTPHRQ
jgi:transmembrane sensor